MKETLLLFFVFLFCCFLCNTCDNLETPTTTDIDIKTSSNSIRFRCQQLNGAESLRHKMNAVGHGLMVQYNVYLSTNLY